MDDHHDLETHLIRVHRYDQNDIKVDEDYRVLFIDADGNFVSTSVFTRRV